MIVQMENISKIFGSAYALKDVNFSVGEAEIHGLMGENGAGKSTLMNILGGVLEPDGGRILINGEEVTINNVKKAQQLGIRFVHQELNMFNDLRVYENMFLGEEITCKSGLLNRDEMKKQTKQILDSMGIDLDPMTIVENLDTSRKQLLEIAKAVHSKCDLIILDEPTTALTNKEIDILFDIMRKLKEKGVSFIFITHKIPEILKICEKYTVLRDGALVGTGLISETDENKITDMLVGCEMRIGAVTKPPVKNDVLLEAKNISCENYFNDLSFTLRRGEVLVMTGLHGDGRGELAEALFGIRKLTSGTVTINNKPVKYTSISNVMKSGISMVQRNRKERSIIPSMSIYDNLSIASFVAKHKKIMISQKEEKERFERNKKKTNIKAPNPKNEITSLSGGNQQKVILSRWLELDSDVYLLDYPTQGIDVGAKQEIYKIINRMAEQEGKGIIVFSDEFPEIYMIADRVLVMYQGKINAELSRDELTETNVMYYSTGSNLVEGAKKA